MCLENEDMGGDWGKVIKCCIRGYHFSEVTSKEGIG